jgi:site-specific DNA-methyltransferase (adenine-specific)
MPTKVEIGNATLFLGNCEEILPSLKADMAFTSPPYNMRTRVRNGQYTEREKSEHFSKKYDSFHDAFSINEYYKIHKNVLRLLIDNCNLAIVNFQIVTGSKEAWFKIIGDFATELKEIAIWDKGYGQPAMHESVINRGHEQILFFEKNAKVGRAFNKYNFERGTVSDIWRIGTSKEKIDGHGATFPIELPKSAINWFTKENETVLDPFMGSGTTGVACHLLNRKFIGIELQEKYFEIACKRIEKAQKQENLFV